MNIYDLTLQGKISPRLCGKDKVYIAKHVTLSSGERKIGARLFKVLIWKCFNKTNDVLQLEFEDGHMEYITLYEPSMKYENGKWQYMEDRSIAEAVEATCAELQAQATFARHQIFDITFYGAFRNVVFSLKDVKVFFSQKARNRSLYKDSIAFTAEVLKEYKGKKYVIKCAPDNQEKFYITLIDSMLYSEEDKKWVEGVSDISNAILKCYLNYLNE